MALTLWDPFTVLSRLDDDFDQLVRRTFAPGGRQRGTSGFVPAVEMLTDGADVVIRLELPGVDVDSDVDIEVSEGRLVISGQRRDEREQTGPAGKVLVRELRYGAFRREFALPEGVTADHVEATYDHGMLDVRVKGLTKPAAQPSKVAVRRGPAARQPSIEGETADTADAAGATGAE